MFIAYSIYAIRSHVDRQSERECMYAYGIWMVYDVWCGVYLTYLSYFVLFALQYLRHDNAAICSIYNFLM